MPGNKLFFALSFFVLAASAQPTPQTCNCPSLLKETIQKVSSTYAGFNDKVTSQTKPQYNQLIKDLNSKANKTTTERGCFEVLKQYADWFKDMHVGAWFGVQSSADKIRRANANVALRNFKPTKNSIEGRWATLDQKERYLIVKDPLKTNQYIAVTLASADSAWKPGMVKAEFYYYEPAFKWYRGMYYRKDFSGGLDAFTPKDGHIEHWFGPWWYREGVPTKKEETEEGQPSVQYKVLNKDFVYLKLGQFNEWQVAQLDSLLKANRSIIYQTKNLIIDLRGNGGGDGGSSQEMIQLIYTAPIIYPAWKYRSSPQMIESTKKYIAELEKADPANVLQSQRKLLERLEAHPGELVSSGDSIVRTVDSVARYPERVAFLIDKGSGSSSEFFIFEGKQSKKVTLFGSNSAGVMDYGNANNANLSCGQYLISVPWGRNGWIERFGYRIDNIGFAPDVRIPATERDWVSFVVKYWSK